MFVFLKVNTNKKFKDSVKQSMRHFLLQVLSLSPKKNNPELEYCDVLCRLTAPSMILKISHRKPQMTMPEGGVEWGRRERVQSGQRNIARKPVSRSCDSHPVVQAREKEK